MRLCFLGTAASIHTYRWVTFFANRGHDTYWLSMAPSIFHDMDGIHFEQIGSGTTGPFGLAGAIRAARRSIRRTRPDVVHAHYLGAYGLIGALARHHPFVGTAWGSDILFAGKSPIKRPFIKHVLRSADVITCDAEHMVRAIGAFGIDEQKIRLIYFGIETDRFRPHEPDRELRRQLGVERSPTVISLRRLEPISDLPTLLRAAALVLKEVPAATFVIVGSGSQEAMLKALAQSLGIAESVLFVGALANQELPRYLTSMDVYVSTSLSDAGIAASTAEAMACGVPVVITDSGENHKWVQSGVTGYVTPVRNPGSLAEKLILLLNDQSLRMALGRAGRAVIEHRNNYYVEMEKMEQIYGEVARPG